jgi:hypothetical protein
MDFPAKNLLDRQYFPDPSIHLTAGNTKNFAWIPLPCPPGLSNLVRVFDFHDCVFEKTNNLGTFTYPPILAVFSIFSEMLGMKVYMYMYVNKVELGKTSKRVNKLIF